MDALLIHNDWILHPLSFAKVANDEPTCSIKLLALCDAMQKLQHQHLHNIIRAVCGDVRPVLREVFRECDYLPPLPTDKDVALREDPLSKHWFKDYTQQCTDLWNKEDELKEEHARRISREPLPNIYKLSSSRDKQVPVWRVKHGFIARRDLIPAVHQNAAGDANLWVKNILNRSSCDVSRVEMPASREQPPILLPQYEDLTIESLSIGELGAHRPPAPPSAPMEVRHPEPEQILCIPPQLKFVNFTVGQLHLQTVRLVNVFKSEVRLSLRPPVRRELDVMLTGSRGLTVTAGATATLRVQFRPQDPRAFKDALVVRTSMGKTVVVPIYCYMQPPVLEVMVPNLTWSSLSCSAGEAAVRAGRDVLELGARLLGDVHCARLLLRCDAAHAAFFVITEDAWLTYCLDTLTCDGAVVSGPFTMSPVWWRGGGAVRGGAWCRARTAGLHAAALRVISSTCVVRPLHLLADALLFSPNHLTLVAHEKDYDICSEDDPACDYYVNLGTAFPNRSLSATVQLVNHSPIVYSYYWSARPWGRCSCWEDEQATEGSAGHDDDSERLCVGAKEARQKDRGGRGTGPGTLARAEPGRGRVAARASVPLQVFVPRTGPTRGRQRAVLMLVLKDIPKESFPPDLSPMIVKTETVIADPIPGHEPWTREVCDVVCLQLEVWWEVVPVRFALDPPLLHLRHSRRVSQVEVAVRATQLFGSEVVRATWALPEGARLGDITSTLVPAHPLATTVTLALPSVPEGCSATDLIDLTAANNEWRSQMGISRRCVARGPRLRPARAALGVLAPGAHLATALYLHNDTHQDICWSADIFRWWGENEPSIRCVGQAPCERCRERTCTCASVRPVGGALRDGEAQHLVYDVNAPDKEGCVATLVRVRCAAAGAGGAGGAGAAALVAGAGGGARASLVSYRVLSPRIVLRVLPCHGEKVPEQCEICTVDPGPPSGGAALLRPSGALCAGRCSCYRLRLTNLTPLPTTVSWEEPIEKEDTIKVTFIPNDFDVGSFKNVEIRMVIKALRVCGRRLFVYRARVACCPQPLYLLVDTAVCGLAVSCEIPLGGAAAKEGTIVITNTQKEQFPWEPAPRRLTANEAFLEEDRKRAICAENICHCRYKMVYKVKPARPKDEGDVPSIEIISDPPPLSRVCACDACSKPTIPDLEDAACLQFRDLPLRTDPWAGDVTDPGVVIQVAPPSGVLGPRARVELTVSAYADTWGLYRDQVLVMVEKLEPLVLDVWIEVVGKPLTFSMRPSGDVDDAAVTLWMSTSDPNRVVRVKNSSRSELVVHSYILLENEHHQDELPFRLYLRFFDVLPKTCPCSNDIDAPELFLGEEYVGESVPEKMDTGMEVYLAADHGRQTDTCFKVEPEVTTIAPGEYEHLHVIFKPPVHGEIASNAVLLLRPLPTMSAGPGWFRPEPGPQSVRLRPVQREGLLRASKCKLHVKFCALGLPQDDVMRIRKTIQMLNVGNGHLELEAVTEGAWSVVVGGAQHAACGAGCGCGAPARRHATPHHIALHYPPMSSNEMTVEVCIRTAETWPQTDLIVGTPAPYEPRTKTITPLHFYDNDNILMTIPLILELEFPIISMEPASGIDFGFVTDGDTRKSYFTVTHSSRTEILELAISWSGSPDFSVWPHNLRLPPATAQRVYVQYTAKWRSGSVEGVVRARACGGAGAWCGAAAGARAAPARDHHRTAPAHDYTDDAHLLPPDLAL